MGAARHACQQRAGAGRGGGRQRGSKTHAAAFPSAFSLPRFPALTTHRRVAAVRGAGSTTAGCFGGRRGAAFGGLERTTAAERGAGAGCWGCGGALASKTRDVGRSGALCRRERVWTCLCGAEGVEWWEGGGAMGGKEQETANKKCGLLLPSAPCFFCSRRNETRALGPSAASLTTQFSCATLCSQFRRNSRSLSLVSHTGRGPKNYATKTKLSSTTALTSTLPTQHAITSCRPHPHPPPF